MGDFGHNSMIKLWKTKVDSYLYQDVVWHAILILYILWYYFLDNQTLLDNTPLIEMSMIINMHV